MKVNSISVKVVLNTEKGKINLHNAVIGLCKDIDNKNLHFTYKIHNRRALEHQMHIQPIDIIPGSSLRVKVVGYSQQKSREWTDDNRGKVFVVIQQKENGYTIDLGPLGAPGNWGFVGNDEVIVTDEPVTEFNEKDCLSWDCKI